MNGRCASAGCPKQKSYSESAIRARFISDARPAYCVNMVTADSKAPGLDKVLEVLRAAQKVE